MASFDTLQTTRISLAIVSIVLSCTNFQVFDVEQLS